MKEIDWFNLSYFQQRRILAAITAMNKAAKNEIPALTGDAFSLHRDKQAAGLMFNTGVAGISDNLQTLNRICTEHEKEIQVALEYVNPFRKIAAEAVSLALWETREAFLVNNKGIRMASGLLSPFYIDNAILFAHPYFMNMISAFAQIEILTTMGKIDGIIGGESRGIPFSTYIAKDLAIGTGIARKALKDHGTKKGIEGSIKPGDRIVIGEDLITDGRSKRPFIEHARREGAIVVAIIVVVDREQGGPEYVKEEYGVDVHTLTNMTTHLEVGMRHGFITEEEKQSMNEYRKDPVKWNQLLTQGAQQEA